MKRSKNEFYELLANMFGVFDTDWQNDFGDDGYEDYFGKKDINEPLFVSDIRPRPVISVEVTKGLRRA